MMKNINEKNISVKEKMNNIKFNKNAENLAAVHTHTHTVYCLLENKINVKIGEYINKDRTMIFFYIMGLSLCVLRYRAGPIGNTI